jgi:hypothetical protein
MISPNDAFSTSAVVIEPKAVTADVQGDQFRWTKKSRLRRDRSLDHSPVFASTSISFSHSYRDSICFLSSYIKHRLPVLGRRKFVEKMSRSLYARFNSEFEIGDLRDSRPFRRHRTTYSNPYIAVRYRTPVLEDFRLEHS